jgi:hypothetical protein
MSQKHTITIAPTLQVSQTRSFFASALPLTMKLAWSRRAIITPLLRNSHQRWPYHDRVLCWLEPAYLAHVVQFHDLNGSSLIELRSPQALERLDFHYRCRLAKRIEGHNPGWTDIG